MFRLFIRPLVEFGQTHSYSMPRLRDMVLDHYRYQNNLYKQYGFYVPSSHILIRLAYVLNNYLGAEKDTYRLISDDLHSICSGLGITFEDVAGRVQSNAFYTKHCLVIAASYDENNPNIAPHAWEDIRPVRCLTHPYTSMDVYVPPIRKQLLGDGISAISIDIPAFGWQLNQWYLKNLTLPEMERESLGMFISKYVIPGMVKEQIDISLRNRLEFIYRSERVPMTTRERSFVLFSEDSLAKPIKQIFHALDASRLRYHRALLQIPMVFNNNYFNAIPMEIAGLNTYSYWVQFIVYLDWLYPMTVFLKSDQKDITDISKILKRVQRFIDGTNCLKYIPDDLRPLVDAKYQKIKEAYQ